MKAQPNHTSRSFFTGAFAAALLTAATAFAGTSAPAGKAPKCPVPPVEPSNWLDTTIPPVTNPVFFEDAVIRSEIRPIFIHHKIDSGFITGGGDVNLWAVQARVALTDRLALIATKDGYIDFNPKIGADQDGWADVALGLKYALIDDRANEFILTPGFTFEIPLGNSDVFQGNGSGEWNVFVSAEKGFGNFHLLGNVGVRVPNDTDEESTSLHYSLQADYRVCKWFIPFVAANGFTVLSEGSTLPINSEGYDLINFGASGADNWTGFTVGGGFRSQLTDNIFFGAAYEKAVAGPEGLYDDRWTFDFVFTF